MEKEREKTKELRMFQACVEGNTKRERSQIRGMNLIKELLTGRWLTERKGRSTTGQGQGGLDLNDV